MAIYLLPIFCFGLVITGIVFLGLMQASDQAKALADVGREGKQWSSATEAKSANPESVRVQAKPSLSLS